MTQEVLTDSDDWAEIMRLVREIGFALDDHPAVTLLGLLIDYADVLDAQELHLRKSIDKEYPDFDTEKAALVDWQKNKLAPLIIECRDCGYELSDLREIMEGPFKTTYADRSAVLLDLLRYVIETYA